MTTPLPDSYVPYARRRNTPEQLDALNRLFQLSTHPTRAQRLTLANDTGMELKSVTNWFQNRRQSSRRKSHSSNENHHRHGRSKTPVGRSKVSLDHIAALAERPGVVQPNLPRSPLSPRKKNIRRDDSELWAHMLSSPVRPSSPAEETRLAALASGPGVLFPLEWACLRARQRKRADEDAPDVVAKHCQEDDDGQVIRLESGAAVPRDNVGHFLFRPQHEDVEAAITLLGFKARSS